MDTVRLRALLMVRLSAYVCIVRYSTMLMATGLRLCGIPVTTQDVLRYLIWWAVLLPTITATGLFVGVMLM